MGNVGLAGEDRCEGGQRSTWTCKRVGYMEHLSACHKDDEVRRCRTSSRRDLPRQPGVTRRLLPPSLRSVGLEAKPPEAVRQAALSISSGDTSAPCRVLSSATYFGRGRHRYSHSQF